MLILPLLLAVGALAALASAGRPTAASAAAAPGVVAGRRRAQGRGGIHAATPATRAVLVLMEYARRRIQPPPDLIASAIEEARRSGQRELLSALVDVYVRPVVEAAEGAQRAQQDAYAHAHAHAPGAWGSPADAYPPPGYPVPGSAPASAYGPPSSPSSADAPGYGYSDPAYAYSPGPPAAAPSTDPSAQAPYQAPPPAAPPGSYAPAPAPGSPTASWAPGTPGMPVSPGGGVLPLGAGASDDDILRMMAHLSTPPGGSAPAGIPMGGPPATGSDTVTVSGRSSPIEGVGNADWSRFCERMSRELPTYTSAHHVGQFRQRRGRLLELGLDPETVLAHPAGQRAAFEADMSDAYGRAAASGLLGYVGQLVEVPVPDGPPARAQITTSGVLSVVQAAGVEGAAGWLGSPEDRRRFRGTTAVFCAANGVF